MILINGKVIPAFEATMTLCNNSSICCDKYDNLRRAVARSKVDRDGHNYASGERIKIKTEYYDFGPNILILHEQNDKFTYITILHGSVFDVTEDINDVNLNMFCAKEKYTVIDQYGKRIKIHNHSDLIKFIENVENSRETFNFSLEKYHNAMEQLNNFRRERSETFNCNLGELFNKLIILYDDITKEMVEALSAYHDCIEQKTIADFMIEPSKKEKSCTIFGLYIAVLRAYILNYQGESMSFDEKIYKNFLHEFQLFLGEHENILFDYSKQFALKQREIEEIKHLLSEQGLDGGNWFTEEANLTIL